jgi:sugar phosphate isomerase/epimerase
VLACVDEAYQMNAEGIAFLAGRYDAAKVEEHYQAMVRSTREICAYAASKGDMAVNLEVFDTDVEKCSLIGPAPLAKRYAEEICREFPRFGLMVDLSHILQLRENFDENLDPIAPYVRHAHIANAVLTKGMPAYGDQHPYFGINHSEVSVATVTAFLKKLFAIGYLGGGNRPVISFEIKPLEGEDSAMIIAGAKRMLDLAWAQLEVE